MNLYHYCTNATLQSILSNRTIWASDLRLSNDAQEGKWIREVFRQCCDERNVQTYERVDLMRQLDLVISLGRAVGFCMFEEPDLLSQWRGYAADGCGVSIGFRKIYFEKLGSVKRDRK